MVVFRAMIELGFAPTGSLRVAGVPLEYPWLAWFLAIWALRSNRQKASGAARLRLTAYEWWLGILSLAGTMWLVQELGTFRRIGAAAWPYWVASGCALAVFLSAASTERPRNLALSRNALPDFLRILGRPVTWVCAIGAFTILSAAPRSMETPTEGRAFQRWYSNQVRATVPSAWQVRPLTLVELTDYQCSVCRQAAARYHNVIRDAQLKYDDLFTFLRIDFPLENECNPSGPAVTTGGLHLAACEAAAAVRLARSVGIEQERNVVEWLWAHQRQLSRDSVFEGISAQFGLDVRGRYDELLPLVRHDAADGRRLGVSGTPTFFLNGRQLPILPAETLEAAIAIEVGLNVRAPYGVPR